MRASPGGELTRAARRDAEEPPHLAGALRATRVAGSLGEEEYDERQARDVELEAGQMVIFDAFLIHGSQPNKGTRDRTGYGLRFMPATSHFDHDATVHKTEPGAGHHVRPLILVRGVNRCALNDFSRGHPDAETDALSEGAIR